MYENWLMTISVVKYSDNDKKIMTYLQLHFKSVFGLKKKKRNSENEKNS